jgi:serine/threonine protein kinase/class 3 adenylate cyclase
MVLVFTDIVRSVDLKQKLGDSAAASLIARHDNIFKALIGSFLGAVTIKDTGDGYLAEFPTTSDAVRFALKFQHAIASEPWGDVPLRVRIGVHLGEVSELDREERTGLSKLSGLAVDLTARVMGLAAPNQILLTRAAFDGARQYIRLHPLDEEGDKDKNLALTWMAHGSYLFQGSDEAMEVFEVGPEGIAPLVAPPDSEKARRSVAAEEEETLGWRPAAGLAIPMRAHWTLESKLGEGGFGEVWLGMHDRTGERRVFKFCFDAEKLRSLKRELVLFRLLRQVLGDRQDIAKLYDVQLDEAPFFLESEFTEDGSLVEWARNQGGLQKVPIEQRLGLIVRTAEAVAAAHSIGVLHKDIKPASILIYRADDGSFRPRLTDFSIGEVTDVSRYTDSSAIKDFSASVLAVDGEEDTGARMYAPPELLAGRPFTIQGDVYSLGVMLYQMVVGDFERPLAQGWEREVSDPLLREDISRCVEGHEQDRLASAKELADRLRTLPQRRKARMRKRAARVTAFSTAVLLVLLGISVVLMAHERSLRVRAERAEDTTDEVNSFMNDTMAEANFWEGEREDATLVSIVQKAANRLDAGHEFEGRPEIESELRATIGHILRARNQLTEAQPHLERALQIRKELHAGDHEDVAESIFELAAWHWDTKDFPTAETMYKEALAMRQRLFGEEHALVADCLNHLGACMDRMERHAEAEQYYKQALDMRKHLFGEVHEDVAASYNNYATCLRGQGRHEEAEPLFRRSLDIITEVNGPDHPRVSIALHNLATDLIELDKLEEARDLLKKSIVIKRETFPKDKERRHPLLAASLDKLAYVLVLLGDDELEEARGLCEEAMEIRSENGQPTLDSAELLALINLKLQHDEGARPLLNEIELARRGRDGGKPPPYGDNAKLLATFLLANRHFAEAEPILLSALSGISTEPSAARDEVLLQLVSLYKEWQKPERAAEYESQLATRGE